VSRYTADSKDRVRDAVDMVALVSARTELRRAGVDSYFGVCPFHDERTPSFHVRPDRQHYYCFGCGASGDPFDFVMETEGLDFKGALESLADRFGVKLETEAEDPAAAARRSRRDRLLALLERAAAYYARYLWESVEASDAREYLLGRGLTEETLREFRVGYSPKAWDSVLVASRRAGYSDEELLAAGLVQRSRSRPGSVYDFFRGRIMFPSADARGHVLGFGGRSMGATGEEGYGPKYKNTAENELYQKRSQLFGIDRARSHAARAGRAILVEGYTDVLALHQAGLRNAVGIMGTSFTDEQVRVLARAVSVLELCLDADASGQEAMVRAARIAAGHKLELRVVALPEGTDPAELVEREGAEALRSRVAASVPFVVFHVERILRAADSRSAEGRDRAAAQLAPVLAAVPPSVLREDLLRRVAGTLQLSEGRLAALIASGASSPTPAVPAAANGRHRGEAHDGDLADGPPPAYPALDQDGRAERTFLAQCVAVPAAGARTLATIDPDELLTSEPMRRAARHIAPRTDAPLCDLPPDDPVLALVVEELVARALRTPDVGPDRLEHALLVLQRNRLEREIRRARVTGSGDVARFAREREQVMGRIRDVVARLEGTV
jgi:DNA primase